MFNFKKHCGPNFSSRMERMLIDLRDRGVASEPNVRTLKSLTTRNLVDAEGVITDLGRDAITYLASRRS